jgi:hypothetical protein
VDVWIIFYVRSGLELKHMEKSKIKQPWDKLYSTSATGLLPALLLGRPGFNGPEYDTFYLCGVFAAGAFTGATGVGGNCLKAASASSLKP